MHYERPEKNQYAYKLEGFDEEWGWEQIFWAHSANVESSIRIFRRFVAMKSNIKDEPETIQIVHL